ncbi:bestrophin family protein [Tautonia plasticadhaerens]|uniref:Bestrophin, RFP-TM, chloride channel n=1 Tax=Tautonia plasticadhaerens TaxID=2527974 RepID=A0A518HEA1_9BACT|nr:bestrophin family ion channel [Tautonia plasticadhaerens]QDV39175.1 Bestrophin, RFP-TM, chloride channel [Tautonia plasticadhaerens]
MIDYDPHRWYSHLLGVRGSMVREISPRVLAVTAWSAAVAAVHLHVLPVAVPHTVHGLVGVALGLLLVFRTNSSYDRYWEGRRLWGGIVNQTRNLARAASVLLREEPEAVGAVVGWTAAFPYAVMHRLRGRPGLGPPGERLPRAEAEQALAAPHVPLAVAQRISGLLAEARARGVLSDYQQMELDRNVQKLVDSLGGCERIHTTPLPYAYVVHLRRALLLYCGTLPFALVGEYGWAAVLDTLLVSYVFFGIEEIGVEIENPFGCDDNDLPLERYCGAIEGNLRGLLGEQRGPVDGQAGPVSGLATREEC